MAVLSGTQLTVRVSDLLSDVCFRQCVSVGAVSFCAP